MDGPGFDRVTLAFAERRSRRVALGGLAAIAALVTGQAEARTRRRITAQSGPPDRIAICHYDKDANTYERIVVSSRSRKAHESHGDFAYGACCADGACASGQVCVYTAGDIGKPSACACDKEACRKLGGRCAEDGTCKIEEGACFWMRVGDWVWVPSPSDAPTIESCQNLDSCAVGGGGASGGGCYRWQSPSGTVLAPCQNDWADKTCQP